jgi:hypothetical protein
MVPLPDRQYLAKSSQMPVSGHTVLSETGPVNLENIHQIFSSLMPLLLFYVHL